MVSSCCGADYEEDVRVCAECGSDNIGEHFAGDEGWTICEDCRTVEGDDDYVDLCCECGEPCEVEEEYEYQERQRENYLEDMRD